MNPVDFAPDALCYVHRNESHKNCDCRIQKEAATYAQVNTLAITEAIDDFTNETDRRANAPDIPTLSSTSNNAVRLPSSQVPLSSDVLMEDGQFQRSVVANTQKSVEAELVKTTDDRHTNEAEMTRRTTEDRTEQAAVNQDGETFDISTGKSLHSEYHSEMEINRIEAVSDDRDRSDWKLNPRYFVDLSSLWGPFDVDLFAAPHNAQLPCFFTKSDDAFSHNWSSRNCWANPPFNSRTYERLTAKCAREWASITVIAPYWPEHRWFQRLIDLSVDIPRALPVVDDLFLPAGGSPVGPPPWPETLAFRISGDPALQASFRSITLAEETAGTAARQVGSSTDGIPLPLLPLDEKRLPAAAPVVSPFTLPAPPAKSALAGAKSRRVDASVSFAVNVSIRRFFRTHPPRTDYAPERWLPLTPVVARSPPSPRIRRREAANRVNQRQLLTRRKRRPLRENVPRDPSVSDIESDVDPDQDLHAPRISLRWPADADRSLIRAHGESLAVFAADNVSIPACGQYNLPLPAAFFSEDYAYDVEITVNHLRVKAMEKY